MAGEKDMQAKSKKDIKDNIHKKKDKASYIIKTVLNSLELLEAFKGEKPELGVSELSKILKLHKIRFSGFLPH